MTDPRSLGIDPAYLREKQYKDPTNLNARIALHARYARAEVPLYPWLAGLVAWLDGGDVLEVGCGPGRLWEGIASLLPHLRLTLTDLSDGMLDAAAELVRQIASIELVATEACDARDLPFSDDSFDVVVANHMLYHVPEPARAVAEFARVLRPDGTLLAATNGPNHLDVITEITRQELGWSSADFVDRRFGRSSGGAILETAFRKVTWRRHESTLICDDPDAVVAYIRSSATGQEASPDQLAALTSAVSARFESAGGVVQMSMDAGAFVARGPSKTNAS
ncbi:MAG TPA: methyltransferase domain-containing protein [Acidimicrobiales bacterium]